MTTTRFALATATHTTIKAVAFGAIAPGKPEASGLVERIFSADADAVMPGASRSRSPVSVVLVLRIRVGSIAGRAVRVAGPSAPADR